MLGGWDAQFCVQGAAVGMGDIATWNTKIWQKQAKTHLQTPVQIIVSCCSCSSFNNINVPSLKVGSSWAERFITGNGAADQTSFSFWRAGSVHVWISTVIPGLCPLSGQLPGNIILLASCTVFSWPATCLTCCMEPGAGSWLCYPSVGYSCKGVLDYLSALCYYHAQNLN